MRLQSAEAREMQRQFSDLMQSDVCDLRTIRRWFVDYVRQTFNFSVTLSTRIETLAYNLLHESLSNAGQFVIITVDTLKDSHNKEVYCGSMTEISNLIKFALGNNITDYKEDNYMSNNSRLNSPIEQFLSGFSGGEQIMDNSSNMEFPQFQMSGFSDMLQALASGGFGTGTGMNLGMKQESNERVTQTAEVKFTDGVPTLTLSSTKTNTFKTSSSAAPDDCDSGSDLGKDSDCIENVSSNKTGLIPRNGKSSIELAIASAQRAKELASQARNSIAHAQTTSKMQRLTRSFTLGQDGRPIGGRAQQVNRVVSRQETNFTHNGVTVTMNRCHTVADKSDMKVHGADGLIGLMGNSK